MSSFDQTFSSFNNQTNKFLSFLEKDEVATAIKLVVLLYVVMAAPMLPFGIVQYFDTFWFRLIFAVAIAFLANSEPKVAIITGFVFCVLINLINNKGPFENFEGPQTAIFPGCLNMTVFDLLESFNNDKEALMNAMMVSRVPGDVAINDYYAPLISTYLLNQGFVLKSPCKPPGVDENIGF